LIEESRSSKINIQEAEKRLYDLLKKYIPKHTCPLAGSTSYMDRLFLMQYMPKVNEYLHYRIIDVSSIKELARYNYFFYLGEQYI
jgi:oligoribonuclease